MSKTYVLIHGWPGLIALLILCSCSPKKPDPKTALREAIEARLDSVDGNFALAYLDLDRNDTLLINSDQIFHAASTMKTPVMIEVYKQAAAGVFKLTDSIRLKTTFNSIADSTTFELPKESDSEKSLYEHIGQNRTIAALTYHMIINSSNMATNLIIELVDAQNVTKTMRELGAKNLTVLRGVEDLKAYQAGMSNTTTAFDLMLLYAQLARGEIVNEAASAEMIDILMDQEFNHVIPARLPDDVRVAHKTGSITGLQHDSGIVFLPGSASYVLVLLSDELSDRYTGVQALADISEMIYAYKTRSDG